MRTLKRSTLFDKFLKGEPIALPKGGVWVTGRIASLEREDGSGLSFNVYFYGGQWAHVYTIDA
jgi:hypothetical protein